MSDYWKKSKGPNPSYRIVESPTTTPANPDAPGPTSPTGKAISSKNAMKHGCCAASTLLLPHEKEEDLKSLEASWCRTYNPQTDTERHLVAELVNADWFLQRATRALADVEAHFYELNPNPAEWTDEQEKKLARHMRYKTAASNLVDKKSKAVEDFRKARKAEKTNEEKMAIAKERLEVYKKKNRPEETWKEHLVSMKKQAIALGFKPPEFDPTMR